MTRAIGKSKAMDMMPHRTDDGRGGSGTLCELVAHSRSLRQIDQRSDGDGGKDRRDVSSGGGNGQKRHQPRFRKLLPEGLQVERDLFRSTFALEDRSEGMAAFIEKRKPVNKNR